MLTVERDQAVSRCADIIRNMPVSKRNSFAFKKKPLLWAEKVLCPLLGIELDPWQKEFLADTSSKRSLLCVHRQAGKSTICAIKAVHTALLKKNQTVLLLSPTQRQSSELHHTVRKILKEVCGDERPTVDNVTSTELNNGSRIISLPGVEWTIRSYHANLIICDESAGIPDEVFAALSPMLLTTNGSMVLLSTPQGQHGFFWEAYNQPDVWKPYIKSVHDNPRMQTPEKIAFLEQEKKMLGSRLYSQEYECQFLGQIEGGIFKREWMKFTDKILPPQARRVRFWDCAITPQSKADQQGTDPDWTVGTRLAEWKGHVVVEDVVRARVGPFDKQNLIRHVAEMDGKDCRIVFEVEGGSAGAEVYDMYSRMLVGYAVRGDHPTGPKEVRCHAFAAALERGDVEIFKADWNKDWIDELVSFPVGCVHDDQCDSVGGAYRYLTQYAEPKIRFI